MSSLGSAPPRCPEMPVRFSGFLHDCRIDQSPQRRRRTLMTFASWQFGVFAFGVFVLYYLPPVRPYQVLLLIAASLVFYGYGQPELLPLLAVAVFGTYLFLVLALKDRALWLPIGIAFNLALLAFF